MGKVLIAGGLLAILVGIWAYHSVPKPQEAQPALSTQPQYVHYWMMAPVENEGQGLVCFAAEKVRTYESEPDIADLRVILDRNGGAIRVVRVERAVQPKAGYWTRPEDLKPPERQSGKLIER